MPVLMAMLAGRTRTRIRTTKIEGAVLIVALDMFALEIESGGD